MYFAFIIDNKIDGCGQCLMLNADYNAQISEEVYNAINEDKDLYIWNGEAVVINPNYDQQKAREREERFYKEFFNTSLGWIRRKPTLADGTEDDFLNNDLPLFAIAMMSGANPVLPIAYNLPDFTQELTKEYMESLQILDQPITMQFINECLIVKQRDFK